MFQVKICGITTVEDARLVAGAGVDAVGLNFCTASSRWIDLDRAREIVEVLPAEMIKVGLFVNAPAEEMAAVHDELGLDLLQLHGDEPPEVLAELGGRPVMRAFRLTDEGLWPMVEYLNACRGMGCMPRLVLVDAYCPNQYGGTGRTVDWKVAAACRAALEDVPMVLAGGLTPENVADAIRTVQPAAVDTASGVESCPGRKNARRVEQFVDAARGAFGS